MRTKVFNRPWVFALAFVVLVSFVLVRAMTKEVAESAGSKETSIIESLSGVSPVGTFFSKGPDHASITIILYTDFRCTPCARAAKVLDKVMDSYPDEIRIVFKHYPSAIRPDAIWVHEASLAAAEQGKFWPMYEKLLVHKGEVTQEDLKGYAIGLDLDRERFLKALDDHRFRKLVVNQVMEARGFGITKAPTFFINGRKLVGARPFDDFKRIIDEELGLSQPTEALSPQPALPSPLSLAEIDIGRSPIRGPSEAPVTIVEFSDFQCPFCARATPTIQQLLDQYPGKIQWVFKHYPLPIHPDAPLAHEASVAAGEQGKFWEMHDLIFINQRAMKREDLLKHATQLGLDMKRFTEKLDSGEFKPVVRNDMEEGQKLGVRGTPTFFINGRRVVGALPFETFQGIVEQALNP